MKYKSIIDEIEQNLITRKDTNLEISETSLLHRLLDEDEKEHKSPKKKKRRRNAKDLLKIIFKRKGKPKRIILRAIVLLALVFFALVFTIEMFAFFLRSIILFPPDNSINDFGTLTMKQPCGVEKHVFLFNTAQCWANTGIEVMEGDKIEIQASGNFYGKISDMSEKAKNNLEPTYWESKTDDDSLALKKELCIYKGDDAKFGSLLVQILPDNRLPLSNDSAERKELEENTRQIIDTIPNGFKVKEGERGRLFVAVNDIYLYDDIINSITNEDAVFKELVSGSIKKADFEKKAKKRREMWFDDNVGEKLLCITITRDVIYPKHNKCHPYSIIARLYRWIEKELGI